LTGFFKPFGYCRSTGPLQYPHWVIDALIISPHSGQAKTCGCACGSDWPRIELIFDFFDLSPWNGRLTAPRKKARCQDCRWPEPCFPF